MLLNLVGQAGGGALTAFNDYASGTAAAPAFTDADTNDRLAAADKLGLTVSAQYFDVTGGTMSLLVEESSDGVHWVPYAGTPYRTDAVPSTGGIAYYVGINRPMLAYLRVGTYFGAPTTTGLVRVEAVGRDALPIDVRLHLEAKGPALHGLVVGLLDDGSPFGG